MTPEQKIADILSKSANIAVLTGAGVSAESGVPTFRGKDGLWKNFRPEELASPYAFAKDPALVWEWYNWRREKIHACEPNPAHLILAKWEKSFSADKEKNFTLITQNVDNLHRKAGSNEIIELHGNIWRVRCVKEGKISWNYDAPLKEIPPKCACGALLRPDIVWFGEALPVDAIERAFRAAQDADIFFSVGTSALVEPAASLPRVALQSGAFVVEINPDETPLTALVENAGGASIRKSAAEALREIEKILTESVLCYNA